MINGGFADETPFLIQSDKTAEETFGFSLSSLLRTPGRNSFLKVLYTPHVCPPSTILLSICFVLI